MQQRVDSMLKQANRYVRKIGAGEQPTPDEVAGFGRIKEILCGQNLFTNNLSRIMALYGEDPRKASNAMDTVYTYLYPEDRQLEYIKTYFSEQQYTPAVKE